MDESCDDEKNQGLCPGWTSRVMEGWRGEVECCKGGEAAGRRGEGQGRLGGHGCYQDTDAWVPKGCTPAEPGTEESGREETTVWMDARNEFRMQWAMPQPSITGTGSGVVVESLCMPASRAPTGRVEVQVVVADPRHWAPCMRTAMRYLVLASFHSRFSGQVGKVPGSYLGTCSGKYSTSHRPIHPRAHAQARSTPSPDERELHPLLFSLLSPVRSSQRCSRG